MGTPAPSPVLLSRAPVQCLSPTFCSLPCLGSPPGAFWPLSRALSCPRSPHAPRAPRRLLPVENENHCDFVKLREMLIRVNMEDLREQTHSRHYELYRRCKLEEMGFQDSDGDSQPFR